MTTMAAHIAGRLAQDTTVVSICGTRVYDRDIRLDGPDAHPEIVGPHGFLLPHIIVDDSGGGRPPLGPSIAYQDQARIVIVAESGSTGRSAIEQLTARAHVRLHRWQEPNTKALISYASRTGYVADPPPGTGAQEVLTFAVAGTLAGVSGD